VSGNNIGRLYGYCGLHYNSHIDHLWPVGLLVIILMLFCRRRNTNRDEISVCPFCRGMEHTVRRLSSIFCICSWVGMPHINNNTINMSGNGNGNMSTVTGYMLFIQALSKWNGLNPMNTELLHLLQPINTNSFLCYASHIWSFMPDIEKEKWKYSALKNENPIMLIDRAKENFYRVLALNTLRAL
jgi:hypothetical protein